MKEYFDINNQKIEAGDKLIYEWRDGVVNVVYVTEQDGDLGVIDEISHKFISLSTTDMAHARVSKEYDYEAEKDKLINSIGKKEIDRLYAYDYCDLDYEFIGFIENYSDLKDKIPKDFTIIDFGSYMSLQADYFKDFDKYIGVEPCVPLEYRLIQNNAEYYHTTAQQFVEDDLPKLIKNGLDKDKVFAIASAVPDTEVREVIKDNFKYYRIAYPYEKTAETFPQGKEKHIKRQVEKRQVERE